MNCESIAESSVKVLKKRGRKKKIPVTDNDNNDNTNNQEIRLDIRTNDDDVVSNIEESHNGFVKENTEIKVHKKRGRKPKNFKTSDDIQYKPSNIVEFEYKKKGRKQKIIVNDKSIIKDKIVFNNNDDENENVVLHLPIHLDKINNNELNNISNNLVNPNNNSHYNNINNNNNQYVNNTYFNTHYNVHTHPNNIIQDPIPYDPTINNISSSAPYLLDTHFSENNYLELDKKKKREIMVQFSECNKRNEWLSSTSIHCFWCAHPFTTIPCTLPHRKINDVYHVFGNFCSPECAASYNFNNYDDRSIEKYSLLNSLYRKIYNNKEYIVELAPPQMSLRIFGGTLTIEQFRSYNKNNNKILMINIPPLVSIIPEIEETNSEINVNNKNNSYIPIDSDRIKNYNEKLKLQRNKPISDKKNTLETCMNLKYI